MESRAWLDREARWGRIGSAPTWPVRLALATAGGSASAAATQGVGGREHEARLPAVVHVVNLDDSALFAQSLVDEIGQPIDLELLVVVLRFVQNQSQRWAASTTGLQVYPERRTQLPLFHEGLDGLAGGVGHFDHVGQSFLPRYRASFHYQNNGNDFPPRQVGEIIFPFRSDQGRRAGLVGCPSAPAGVPWPRRERGGGIAGAEGRNAGETY